MMLPSLQPRDSETSGKLHAVCARGYEEDRSILPKVWECLHISELFEHADDFDIIHNHFDFLPLTYTGLITTPFVDHHSWLFIARDFAGLQKI